MQALVKINELSFGASLLYYHCRLRVDLQPENGLIETVLEKMITLQPNDNG